MNVDFYNRRFLEGADVPASGYVRHQIRGVNWCLILLYGAAKPLPLQPLNEWYVAHGLNSTVEMNITGSAT